MKTYSLHIKVLSITLCAALLTGGCGGSGSEDGSASNEVDTLLCWIIFPLCLFQKAAEPEPGQNYLKAADLIAVIGTSQDTQRNGYAAGYASSGADGDLDAVVQKLDPDGNLLWTRRFGSPDNEYAEHVAMNDDGTLALTVIKMRTIQGEAGPVVHETYHIRLNGSGEVLNAWQGVNKAGN